MKKGAFFTPDEDGTGELEWRRVKRVKYYILFKPIHSIVKIL